MGAQFALGPCYAPGCRRCEAASQPSLLALPQRSVTRARYRGAVITAGKLESWRPPQTWLASWQATHGISSFIPPLPTNVHASHARQQHAPPRLRGSKNRCAEQGHTLRATCHHPPALIVFLRKTLASRSLAPIAELPNRVVTNGIEIEEEQEDGSRSVHPAASTADPGGHHRSPARSGDTACQIHPMGDLGTGRPPAAT